MTEFYHDLEIFSEAASEADFLPSDHIDPETKQEIIGEKLQELWEGMADIALTSGELSKYRLLNRVVPRIYRKEIGFGFYGDDSVFMDSLDGRFGMSVAPAQEEGKATVSILVHPSIWADLTIDQRQEDLVNHMWNIFHATDKQTRAMKREGSFVPYENQA